MATWNIFELDDVIFIFRLSSTSQTVNKDLNSSGFIQNPKV